MPRVKLHWVPDSEIKETEAKLAKRFDSTKTLKGTRGYHNFVPVDKKNMRVKQYKSSAFKETKKISKY